MEKASEYGKNILRFLNELKQHNDRTWFNEHKEWYQQVSSQYEEIVEQLLARMSSFDDSVLGLTYKDCSYRIYRDLRFTEDKSPYKTHIGAYMVKGGKKSMMAGYYFHIEPGSSMICAGIHCTTPPLLKALRQAIYDNMEEFKEIVESKECATFQLSGEDKLKTVPRGFPKDCDGADYLKYKRFDLYCELKDDFFEQDDFIEKSVKLFERMAPFNKFLNYTAEEVLY